MTVPICLDCGAEMQRVNGSWRCPWVTPAVERHWAGRLHLLYCGKPFTRSQDGGSINKGMDR